MFNPFFLFFHPVRHKRRNVVSIVRLLGNRTIEIIHGNPTSCPLWYSIHGSCIQQFDLFILLIYNTLHRFLLDAMTVEHLFQLPFQLFASLLKLLVKGSGEIVTFLDGLEMLVLLLLCGKLSLQCLYLQLIGVKKA